MNLIDSFKWNLHKIYVIMNIKGINWDSAFLFVSFNVHKTREGFRRRRVINTRKPRVVQVKIT